MQTTMTLTATWDARQGMYIQRDLAIWSEDGDVWHDDYGGHPDSDEFRAAVIALVGGPRDGETVA